MMMAREPVTIRLHGPLAETYGREHRLAIASPREAIDALDTNYPGFRRDFLKVAPRYGLYADGAWLEEDTIDRKLIPHYPIARELDICPVIEGRLVGAIAAGIGAVIPALAGTVAATIIGGAITLGLLIGVSLLLAPKVKKKSSEDSAKDESYLFSGPENVTEQGVAVPLIYGVVHCGSVVISAGMEVSELPISGVAGTTSTTLGTEFPLGRGAQPVALPRAEDLPLQPDLPAPFRTWWRPLNA